ncbi:MULTISPECIES: ATP-grasp domain-containing protein [Hyphobacterium]|uniref:RimK family alpha-L-glutamate ligase n=1 Tax=Hyphobacterium vulgare TaxID=1736751 RepID=A0ABV6ZXB6_9PROT
MIRIAFLTASCMIEGTPGARSDAWEHTLEFAAIRPACEAAGIELVEAIWDDPGFDPAAFDAIVVGTCWDYMQQPETFLAALDRFAAVQPVLNPIETIRWNTDKGYLAELETGGIPTIPTLWADRADAAAVARAFAAFPESDRLVIKPRVGGGAWRQARVSRGEALPPADEMPPGACLIQPFLGAAEREGETTLLFFDRVFSHALVKRPKPGDYRTQSMYGATEAAVEPDGEALQTAAAALDAVEGELLYARVDLMRRDDGRYAVMELELIEPYYYPEQGPELGRLFAAGLKRLAG